jgi:flagellar protein FliS
MHNRLIEANTKSDTEILNEVLDLFREFRDTWKEAMVLAKKATGRVGSNLRG